MTSFTIIGTGNMGSAIGGVLAGGGSDVTHVTREQLGSAPLTGDVVILAVPYSALEGIIAAYGEHLAGKTVVDITNPLDFATFDSLVVPAGSSAVRS
jgi:predicted dinucleotide-binding enzyme